MQNAPLGTLRKSHREGTLVTSLWALVAFVAFGILTLEFTYDLSSEPTLYFIAISLDFALVASFVAYVWSGAYKARNDLWAWFQSERVNLILLFLIVPA